MAKCIDTEPLLTEIEKEIKILEATRQGCGLTEYGYGRLDAFHLINSIIDSLQQKQSKTEEDWVEKRKQECGYRKLSANGSYQCEKYEGSFGPCDGRCSWIVDYSKLKKLEKQEQSDTDIEEEIKFWIQNHVKGGDFEPYKTIKKAVIQWGEFVARRFYELGLKAKEKSK